MDKYKEFNRIEKILMNYPKPSEKLGEIIDSCESFSEYPLKWIKDMKNIMQNKKHHPEGDVLSHTLMVVDQAAKVKDKSKDSRVFMWGALLHDIGKLRTTEKRNGRLTAYNHDKVGALMAEEFLDYFNVPDQVKKRIVAIVRWHMQPLFIANNIPMAQIDKMLGDIDIEEIALFCRCDRFGRGGLTQEDMKREKGKIKIFVEESSKIKSKKQE